MNLNLLKKKLVNKYPQFGKHIHYNFDVSWEEDEKDHVLGGFYDYDNSDILPDGDWHKPLKEILTEREFFEIQKGRFLETYGCTGYGTLNAIELLVYERFGLYWNKSDRFTNKNSNVRRGGTSIKKVFESIRDKDGLVNEADYPWDRKTFKWNDYYATIPSEVPPIGKEWLKKYSFHYEKLKRGHEEIKRGLKKSPVGIGVAAWYKKNGVYYSSGRVNHWTLIIKQNWGKNYIILDSYPPYIKILDWNFKFAFPRIFFIDKLEPVPNKKFIDYLMDKRGKKYIQRTDQLNGGLGQVYELSKYGYRELSAQEKLEVGIKSLDKSGEMVGISEKDFKNLDI